MYSLEETKLFRDFPKILPIITLGHPRVFYPYTREWFTVVVDKNEDISLLAEDIRACENVVVFVPTKRDAPTPARPEDIYSDGTFAHVEKMEQTPEGQLKVYVHGLDPVKIGQIVQEKPYLKASVELNSPRVEFFGDEIQALEAKVLKKARRLLPILARLIKQEEVIERYWTLMTLPFETSFYLAFALQVFADMDWSQINVPHRLKMNIDLRLQLLICDSDNARLTLLNEFLDTVLPVFDKRYKLGEELDPTTGKATGNDITLTPKEFALGGYFVGKRRSGKSTLLEHLIVQSINFGRGVCLIDPHGDLLQAVTNRIPEKRLNDVILLDPLDHEVINGQKLYHHFGLNIYHCEDKNDPVAVDYTTNLVMDLYKKLWKSEFTQPMVEDIILMTTLTIIANDMTMVEVPRLLFDDAFRRRLVANVTNPDVLDFWKVYDNPRSLEREQGGGTVGRRLRQFTTSGILRYIVGQKEKALRLRDIIDQKKILLIRLYSDLPQLTSLIGSTIVSQMLQAALSRSDTSDRPEFHLFCDEYSRFAVESFAQIIEEAGKYNIFPFIAHQSRGQISEENQDSAIQLGNLFCFCLIGKDAEKLADEFDTTPPLAKKPEPTIPTNVVEHLHRHPDVAVRRFYNKYIRRWEEAAKKRKERHYNKSTRVGEDGLPPPEFYDEYPEADLGAGTVRYDPEILTDAILLLNDLLYETQMRGRINTQMYEDLTYLTSNVLDEAFVEALDDVLHILASEEGKIAIPSTEWQDTVISQQTHADKRLEIANELVHLDRGVAKVKLVHGEYTIKTIPSTTSFRDSQKKQTILEQTRKKYTKTRAEVEEEIANRIRPQEPPFTKL